MAHPLYRHPTRSEILELAVEEGHDADIPTNAGSIQHARSNTPPPSKLPEQEKRSSAAIDKDIEKGIRSESLSSGEDVEQTAEETDPNIVWWDGPNDPQNPMNWRYTKKWGTVLLVSAITFLTPLASSMFAPGVPQVMRTFNSTNDMLEGFMVSVYVLGFAFGPLSTFYTIHETTQTDETQLLRHYLRCTAVSHCIIAVTAFS